MVKSVSLLFISHEINSFNETADVLMCSQSMLKISQLLSRGFIQNFIFLEKIK